MALDTALLSLIAPLLPEIERRTGASAPELGLALAAYAVPILLVSLPLGRLADSIGRRPVLISGLLLTAAGSFLIAASESLPALILGRGVQGVGAAAGWIAALAIVSDLTPPERKGEAIGFAFAAGSVGAIGGPAIGGITAELVSFEFPFLLVAGLSLAFLLAVRALIPAPERGKPRESGLRLSGLLRMAGSPAVRVPALMVVAGATSLALVDVVVPLEADERLGLSAAAIGGMFTAATALDLITAPVAGRTGDRAGRLPVALAGVIVIGCSMFLLAFLPGAAGLALGLAIYGIGISTVFASTAPWLDDAFGDLDRAYGFGFLQLLVAAGFTAGPLLAGTAYDLGGPLLAYGLTCGTMLVVALTTARTGTVRAGR